MCCLYFGKENNMYLQCPDIGQFQWRPISHLDKYFDTLERSCHKKCPCAIWKALVSYDQCIFFFNWSNIKDRKVKYQLKDLITRDIHVKYESSIHKLSAKYYFFKSRSNSTVKVTIATRDSLSQWIFKWNIKVLAFTLQKKLPRLMFKKISRSPGSMIKI